MAPKALNLNAACIRIIISAANALVATKKISLSIYSVNIKIKLALCLKFCVGGINMSEKADRIISIDLSVPNMPVSLSKIKLFSNSGKKLINVCVTFNKRGHASYIRYFATTIGAWPTTFDSPLTFFSYPLLDEVKRYVAIGKLSYNGYVKSLIDSMLFRHRIDVSQSYLESQLIDAVRRFSDLVTQNANLWVMPRRELKIALHALRNQSIFQLMHASDLPVSEQEMRTTSAIILLTIWDTCVVYQN